MWTEALTCQEVRPLLAQLAAGELRPAERGRIEGHIYGCDECADALGQFVAEAILDGRVVKTASALRSQVDEPRIRAPKILMWHGHRISTPAAFRERYRASLSSARATRGIALDGESAVELLIQAIDRSWNVIDTEPVRSYLISPPVFTPDGEFRMRLELSEQDLARCEGRSIICLVRISDESSIGFESLVTGREVAFAESGLPDIEDFASPPPELLELYLAPEPSTNLGA